MSEEAHHENRIQDKAESRVWTELMPRVWAAATNVVGLIAAGLCVATMIVGTAGAAGPWLAIGTVAAFAATGFCWWQREKSENYLRYSDLRKDAEEEIEPWKQVVGVEKTPQQQHEMEGQMATGHHVSDHAPHIAPHPSHAPGEAGGHAPSRVEASQFASAAPENDKRWTDTIAPRALETLQPKLQESFAAQEVQRSNDVAVMQR